MAQAQAQLVKYWNFEASDHITKLWVFGIKEIQGIFNNKAIKIKNEAELLQICKDYINSDWDKTERHGALKAFEAFWESHNNIEYIPFFYSLLSSSDKFLETSTRQRATDIHQRFLEVLNVDNDTKHNAEILFQQLMEKFAKLQTKRDEFIQSLEDKPNERAIALRKANRYCRNQMLQELHRKGLVYLIFSLMAALTTTILLPEALDFLGNLIYFPFISPSVRGALVIVILLLNFYWLADRLLATFANRQSESYNEV